ncbi:MAG: type II toxin-antitoxin system RelE/ParE family toxin [Myxococcales bacterium]|jgi:toxin ParE1/3/4|nr:type II toxin-antitoxin system RelE/ParE family toxin [Myxococcales bacterium]
MKVQFTRGAAARWHEVLSTIGSANRFAVPRIQAQVRRSLRRIGQFPSSGNFVREYSSMPVREFIVDPYRFVYYVDEPRQLIRIVAVWHGAQLPAQPDLPAP